MCILLIFYIWDHGIVQSVKSRPESFNVWLEVLGKNICMPAWQEERKEEAGNYQLQTESKLSYEEVIALEAKDEPEAGRVEEEPIAPKTKEIDPPETVSYELERFADFDFVLHSFYHVDPATTINSSQLNGKELMEQKIQLSSAQAKILIYHTHSQEGYADTVDGKGTVVDLGEQLTELLKDQYHLNVLHHTGCYDVPDRDSAYTRAAKGLEQVLAENPDIEAVIDLHRDGVPEGTHLVTQVEGRPTAQIMFFNGLSRTTAGEISYLPNPNLQTNLAFSLQMQVAANTYYPGFSRMIYLKGYRYNMHYCPRSLLVEVGAQTNTIEEAQNAMQPLADLLAKVLSPS